METESNFILKIKPVPSLIRLHEIVVLSVVAALLLFISLQLAGIINELFEWPTGGITVLVGTVLTISGIMLLHQQMSKTRKRISYIFCSDRIEIISPAVQKTIYLKEVVQITMTHTRAKRKGYDDIGSIIFALSNNNLPLLLENIPNVQDVYNQLLLVHEKARSL